VQEATDRVETMGQIEVIYFAEAAVANPIGGDCGL
jgi:hypothetical protein